MDRRAFLTWVGVGLLASSLPIAIAACSSDQTDTAQTPTAPRTDGFSAVGSLKGLEAAGFIQDKTFAAGPLLVVQDSTNPAQLIAMNATCTHKGCTVDWSGVAKEFVCPCHGSKFKPDGSVANGPATKPLTAFTVKTEGDSILVKAV